jgi:TrmH family RNA methyltransferase
MRYEGTNINAIEPPVDGILVLGNESLGVSDELMHQVKDILSIPGQYKLGAESLNVASAAAILANWWRG